MKLRFRNILNIMCVLRRIQRYNNKVTSQKSFSSPYCKLNSWHYIFYVNDFSAAPLRHIFHTYVCMQFWLHTKSLIVIKCVQKVPFYFEINWNHNGRGIYEWNERRMHAKCNLSTQKDVSPHRRHKQCEEMWGTYLHSFCRFNITQGCIVIPQFYMHFKILYTYLVSRHIFIVISFLQFSTFHTYISIFIVSLLYLASVDNHKNTTEIIRIKLNLFI